MWWVNKFGSVSGPYSDEQIRKGIQQNVFTRLHKISSDRQSWQRIDQTEFWNPVVRAPVEMDIPVECARTKIGRIVHAQEVMKEEPEPITPTVEPDWEAVPRTLNSGSFWSRHKMVLGIVSVVCALVIGALICVFWVEGKKSHPPAPVPMGEEPSKKEESSKKRDVAADDFEEIKKRVVLIHTKESRGTGFLVEMDGKKYVLTNDHVIRGKTTPVAVLVDGTNIELGNLSIAEDRDLARYEVQYDGEYFELSDKVPNNNDEVWVYGNSMGDDVITSLRGFVTGVGNKVLKVNAEIVNGNSGSPIVGKDGKVMAVAAYARNGDKRHDWTTRDTSFDSVRRFGIRTVNVNWVAVNRRKYEQDCAKIALMGVYWDYLVPYLICLDVSEERLNQLKLEHKDVDRKSFDGDDVGFHEMLMEVSRAYAGQGTSWQRWRNLCQERDAFIKSLGEAIQSGRLTRENGEKALDEFDKNKMIGATWEKVKANYRTFLSKRKEALMLGREFLTRTTWQDPLMRHGYSEGSPEESVDWYLEGIQYYMDRNTQQLKDLNKTLKKFEQGDDDDEE